MAFLDPKYWIALHKAISNCKTCQGKPISLCPKCEEEIKRLDKEAEEELHRFVISDLKDVANRLKER